jgi:mannose-6-phosphate isomerase-like protein (cupin superfamily)
MTRKTFLSLLIGALTGLGSVFTAWGQAPRKDSGSLKKALFRWADLRQQRAKTKEPWLEFFASDSLSTGIYVLPAGGVDTQKPHRRDEVYYIVRGTAKLTVDQEEHPVEAGSVIFVKAGVDHRFHSITEELEVLVFFAGAR